MTKGIMIRTILIVAIRLLMNLTITVVIESVMKIIGNNSICAASEVLKIMGIVKLDPKP